jgi:DNA-binding PadR family transcriptional regulator
MPGKQFPAQYAVLGVLTEGELHGYELRRRLSAALGSVWHIATSQLYSVLHRLEEEGLLSVRIDEQERRPPRKVYAITAQGEKAFWEWATTPVCHVRDLRVELLAKLYFLHRLAPERITALINAEAATLDRLHNRLSRKKNLSTEDETLGRLALQFRLGQVESARRWLDKCLKDLTQSEAPRPQGGELQKAGSSWLRQGNPEKGSRDESLVKPQRPVCRRILTGRRREQRKAGKMTENETSLQQADGKDCC